MMKSNIPNEGETDDIIDGWRKMLIIVRPSHGFVRRIHE